MYYIYGQSGPSLLIESCHGNFGPENFGPGDRNSTKMFRGISVLSWNLSPPVNKIRNSIRK